MTQRAIAFAVIVLLVIIGLWVSESRPANAGLPLVSADYAVSCSPLMPIQPTKPKRHPFGRKADTA